MQSRHSTFLIVVLLLGFIAARTGIGHGLTHLDEADHDDCEWCDHFLQTQEETPYHPCFVEVSIASTDQPVFRAKSTPYFECTFCFKLPRRVMNKPPPAA